LKKTKRRFLSSYSVFNIVIIAVCAGLGIAVKPVLVPLVHIITGPLFIPGGAVAGGFYMLFIVLAAGLVRKPGAAVLTCAVQAILVIITGVIGSHGIMSLATYILPGAAVDLFLLTLRKKEMGALVIFISGLIANLTGSFLSNVVFFRLPIVPLMLTLFSASLSGGLGGLIAFGIIKKITQFNPAFKKTDKEVGTHGE
jgi:ABC-type thiamin/hydroxymethylpyrimidine transport system permease subunit